MVYWRGKGSMTCVKRIKQKPSQNCFASMDRLFKGGGGAIDWQFSPLPPDKELDRPCPGAQEAFIWQFKQQEYVIHLSSDPSPGSPGGS